MRTLAALTALLLADPVAQWAPETRVVIGDFSVVDAVAASAWTVFGATRHGLIIYDRLSRTWRAPVTSLDGYPAARVRVAVADPSGNGVWLGLSSGGYVRFDVDTRQWTLAMSPPASPDATAGVLTVEQALARAPAADALRALMLTDPRLRTYQFTSAAATPDKTELYFGTNGMGLVRVDPLTGEWEALPFGLVAPGVGALTALPGGVWTAAGSRPGGGDRRGLTWVAEDLSATRTSEGGGAALGFAFLMPRRLLAVGDALWLATERGVLRVDLRSMRTRQYDVPDATSLAPAPDGVWVGSTRGVAVVSRDDTVVPVGSRDVTVLSLVAQRETLWVGTAAGMGVLEPGAATAREPAELAARPSLRVPILALARAQDTVVAATERSLLWRDPQGAHWTEVPLPLSLGRPTALAADPERGVWIGGTQGLAHADLSSAAPRLLTVPLDLPAAVRDVAATRDYLWVATDSGLVRFDRRAALHR